MAGLARTHARIVSAYGLAHGLVDASCAATIFNAIADGRSSHFAAAGVVIYNLLAFASQPVLGWLVNDEATARKWALAGAVLTAAAFPVSLLPGAFWFTVALAGIGNAVFHLGGGVVCLRLRPGTATLPGLFVAPGAAGLAAGIALGSAHSAAWLPAAGLLLVTPLLGTGRLELGTGRLETQPSSAPMRSSNLFPASLVALVFVVVALRAFTGSALALPWKSQPSLLWGLTAAVVLGKALGGIAADRFGRIAAGVGALLLSAPLLVFAPSVASVGIIGMLLFNMTMPVTLVALSDALPERPGFAFGLTCLALAFGSLPLLLRLVPGVSAGVAGGLAACSAGLLWLAFRSRRRSFNEPLMDLAGQEVV